MTENYKVSLEITGANKASPALQTAKRDIDGVGASAQRTGGLLSGMQGMLGGLVAGIGIAGITAATTEIYNLGQASLKTEAAFTELSGGASAAIDQLSKLKTATGGIVGEMDLMQGANVLMSMGLAKNSDEVARLTELAVKLGGAMGNDAASSIADFASMLANDSVLRLDTFGISSSAVKVRIDELLASGQALDRSEAFRMATLEIGAQSLDRLGDAATVGETAIARLQTRWNDWTTNVAEDVAGTLNAAATSLEQLAFIAIDAPQIQAQQDSAIAQAAYSVGTIYGSRFSEAFATSLTTGQAQAVMAGAYREMEEGLLTASGSSNDTVGRIVSEMFGGSATDEDWQSVATAVSYLQEQRRAIEDVTRAQEEQIARQDAMNGRYERSMDLARAFAEEQRAIAFEGTVAQPMQQLAGLFGGGTRQYFSADEGDQAAGLVGAMDAAIARAQELGIEIDEATLSGAANARQMADAIQAGADAFKDLTLDQALFGNVDQNELLGGLGGMLDTSNWTQEQLDQLGLATGQETAASIAAREALEQLSAMNPDDAMGGIQGIADIMRASALQGATPEMTADAITAFQQRGFNPELMGAVEYASGIDLSAAAADATAITDSLTEATTEVDAIAASLEEAFGQEYPLRIRPEMVGNLSTFLTALGLDPVAIVRAGTTGNNGNVPGSNTDSNSRSTPPPTAPVGGRNRVGE